MSDNVRALAHTDGRIPTCLRWAGGKRRQLDTILRLMPDSFSRYYEPMLGGASIYLGLHAEKAILGDSNEELISFFETLRDYPGKLVHRLSELSASKSKYYELRSSNITNKLDRAVRFAYLNRLSWNGLYRVNREGKFNVPFGNRHPKQMWDLENMTLISQRMANVKLFSGDFVDCVADATEGDFVFIDPPYPRGSSNGLGFNRYTSSGFSYSDHERLADAASDLNRKGVKVMICETSDPKITSLFPPTYQHHNYTSKSLIAASSEARRSVVEVILTNYRT